MLTLITGSIIGLVVLVIISEIYKMSFERSKESKDERGQILLFKIKSFSYSLLTIGIIAGVILVAILDLVNKDLFIYYVMIIFFIQSIASSIYLAIVRKI
ncbi:hypothetical protein P9B03_02550 [Metasolibacillus meyeri]|uniref:DUF3784 domain-containing protein n=1 Tax=Metasolibacillus meyeri TaxID=1071052 RepID=A0AAW9NJT1_9BACL|nr:hypothetical protein [Metasolibacillus meyeri]MEC1177352.1 hypothetical protein [Metasolibacillus meyeri]